MALLRAYFDESGTHGEAAVTVIAGFVGTKKAWEGVESGWAGELALYADRGVKTFHMADLLAQSGEFARIDRPHLNGILTQLSKLLGSSGLSPICSSVVNEDWDAVVSEPAFLARFPKPFDLCFEDVVRQLWIWAARNTRSELVAPMFAYQNEYHQRMGEIGRLYGSQDWYRKVLGPIAFDFPDRVIPLQAADFLAHQMNWSLERREYGPVTLAEGDQTIALSNATPRGTDGHILDADSLRVCVKNFVETGEIYRL